MILLPPRVKECLRAIANVNWGEGKIGGVFGAALRWGDEIKMDIHCFNEFQNGPFYWIDIYTVTLTLYGIIKYCTLYQNHLTVSYCIGN